jgi:predicted amidophosphoribosyltransferase
MQDKRVVHDTALLADFVSIWCDGHHVDRVRSPIDTAGARLGVYRGKQTRLCAECEGHLAYAEQRRAYCPRDPKPFCAHCETHCYREAEREWQREMMRYSGPRSWRRGHAIDGVKHALEARAYRKRASAAAALARSAAFENPNDQKES